MGSCVEPPKTQDEIPAKIQKLKNLRSQMMTSVEMNKVKIEQLDAQIANYDNQIKQGENDLRQNQYSYSEAEQKEKAKKLFEIKKDRLRADNQRKSLTAYNDNMKNNLDSIESKINELQNYMQINAGNDIMNEVGMIDTGEALAMNIQNMMKQQQIEKQNLGILENGNRAMNYGMGNEDDYLKQILGGGTGGAPPAY